jgi:hypothetical protein
MSDEMARMVGELFDRQAIRDKVTDYCRATDRLDRELLLSVYHPDAIDDHGIYVGSPEGFVDYSCELNLRMHHSTQHIISNHSCELDGDVAHCETYWMVVSVNKQGAPLTIFGGRYIDRFEKRGGEWRIAARKCVPEWSGVPGEAWQSPEFAAAFASGGGAARDRRDASYQRPLRIDSNRIGFKLHVP